jgi:hypothetical protein
MLHRKRLSRLTEKCISHWSDVVQSSCKQPFFSPPQTFPCIAVTKSHKPSPGNQWGDDEPQTARASCFCFASKRLLVQDSVNKCAGFDFMQPSDLMRVGDFLNDSPPAPWRTTTCFVEISVCIGAVFSWDLVASPGQAPSAPGYSTAQYSQKKS